MAFGFLSRTAQPAAPEAGERVHRVAGRELPLRVVENVRARRLTLRIDAGGQGLRVTVPPGLRAGEVDRFLDRHRDWAAGRT
jgi:predicted metal-dependent hydrolase